MLDRRVFIKNSLLVGIGLIIPKRFLVAEQGEISEASAPDEDFVILYDTYAMALYMDGSLGPKTGILKVDYILENKALKFKFWHGHGGKDHEFVLLQEHYAELKKLKRIYLETTIVDGHKHKLFIDPVEAKWRVPGALPIKVPT